jgi:hypothetical protein
MCGESIMGWREEGQEGRAERKGEGRKRRNGKKRGQEEKGGGD